MIETKTGNKPLTVDERLEITRALSSGFDSERDKCADRFLERIVESEAYWREAVENTYPHVGEQCQFCKAPHVLGVCSHDPGCSWVAAQDLPVVLEDGRAVSVLADEPTAGIGHV